MYASQICLNFCFNFKREHVNTWNKKKMELFMKNSYRAILDDVAQMIEKYMSLVKNFPITFNGSKIRQTIEGLISQINKVAL